MSEPHSTPSDASKTTEKGSTAYCLQCGYDLRGIPQHRCPECGFGYDHAAIRCVARHDDYVQDLATRKTLIVSAYAAALAVAPLTQQFGMPFLPRLVIVGISFFGALAIRYRYADARRAGFFTETELFFVFGLLTVLAAELLALVPTLGKILGGITLLRAWYGWSVGCRQFPFSVSFSKLS